MSDGKGARLVDADDEKRPVQCPKCRSHDVDIDLDYGLYEEGSWINVYFVCRACQHSEPIIESS